MARVKKKTSSVKVNFKGIESRKTPPEGDYVASVLTAENVDSSAGNEQIKFELEVSRGESKGAKLYFYCPLVENSLWKLHAFLTALGEDVPEDEVDIDLADLVGKELVVVLSHETYQGKKQAKITDFQSIEDYDGDADMGEKAGKGKADKAPNYKKMDEDDLRELYIERKIGDKKTAKKLDEDELIEALEEFDEEAAAAAAKTDKKSGGKKGGKKAGKKADAKKAKKYDKDDVEDMDEDELQVLIDEADLDVDLDDFKGLKKQVKAVIAELEEKDLLDD